MPVSQLVRYFFCSADSVSILMPIAASLRLATSSSIASGTLCTAAGSGSIVAVQRAASACVAIPDAMSFEHGAVFLSSYGTAYHALAQRGALQVGESLLILGAASGVGLSAVQLGKAMGARVIAAASSREKLALALAHGADEAVLHPSEALDAEGAKAFTATLKALVPGGIEVICDIIGGPYTEAALRAVAWQGRLLIAHSECEAAGSRQRALSVRTFMNRRP